MRRRVFIGAYGFFIGLGALFAIYVGAESPHVSLGGVEYKAIIVDDYATKAKGLGDRDDIGDDQAMLFVFDQPAQQCFWMKDMRFPIDMVWLSATSRIVHIERNVSPRTYPHSFCPPVAAKYVIETNAHQVHSAKVGDIVHIHY